MTHCLLFFSSLSLPDKHTNNTHCRIDFLPWANLFCNRRKTHNQASDSLGPSLSHTYKEIHKMKYLINEIDSGWMCVLRRTEWVSGWLKNTFFNLTFFFFLVFAPFVEKTNWPPAVIRFLPKLWCTRNSKWPLTLCLWKEMNKPWTCSAELLLPHSVSESNYTNTVQPPLFAMAHSHRQTNLLFAAGARIRKSIEDCKI